MSEPLYSRPYSTDAACEKCAFGTGRHAEFCYLHVLPGCQCHLSKSERERGQPHSTCCPLYEKREAAA